MDKPNYSKFFKENREKLFKNNIGTIKNISVFYGFALIIFSMFTGIVFRNSPNTYKVLIVFLTMLFIMFLLYIITVKIQKNNINNHKLNVALTYISMTLSMAFIIYITTIAVSIERRASFFLLFNAIVPTLYMLNRKEMVLSTVISSVVFLTLSLIFRKGMFTEDFYIAVSSLIVGIPYNIMIYNIKVRDAYSKHLYLTQANLDVLTELPNRRAFNYQIEKVLVNFRAKSLGLVIVDLDNFKNLNDLYGHNYGDYAIKELGNRLKTFAEENQLFASRVGGDEFVFICLNYPALKLNSVIEALLEVIKEIKLTNNESIRASAGGFYTNNIKAYNAAKIFNKADQALYNVKQNKKGEYKLIVDEH